MNRIATRATTIILISLSIFVFSCSDTEPRMGLLGQMTTVVINLGLPEDHAANDTSLIDRIRHFFIRDAIAQTVPAAFSSVKVRIAGTDFGLIEKDFAPYGTITLSVPSGKLRAFEVTAYVAPGSPSGAVSFRGTAISNLQAGETVSLPIVMSLNETKIVVPNQATNNICMLDDMAGTNWKTFTYTVPTSTFTPSDIAYDNMGRIYISNEVDSSVDIIRIDDINGTNAQAFNPIPNGMGYGNIVRMAIDRQRNMIYFITATDLFKASLNDINNAVRLNTTSDPAYMINSNMTGIDIDGFGMLYLITSTGAQITKYDPDQDLLLYRAALPNLNNAQDLYIRYPYIYVANFNGASGATPSDGYQILKYQINGNTLNLVGHFGNKAANTGIDNSYGMFYGARNFIAIRNDYFIIIDNALQGTGPNWLCKLVSTGITTSIGWQPYGAWSSSASGAGYFKFYSTC